MARSSAAAQPDLGPEPPPIPRICANCAYWRVRHNMPTFGECAKSKVGLGAPMMTTDLTKCSAFDLRPA